MLHSDMKNFLKSFGTVAGKSALKGLKAMGQVAAAGGITAVLTDPGVIAGVAVAAGPFAPLAVLSITFLLRAGLDAVKHRDKIEP